jgi:MYXO-CTERM domain-containing protein
VLVCLAACHRGEELGSSHHAGGAYPEIDFSERPDYLPDNVVVLTFDDGPDWNHTATVLDILADRGAKATFFINTENWSNVNTEPAMQDLVRRMVTDGHELANHTVAHLSLPSLSGGQIEAQIGGVEDTVQNIFGADAPRLTLLRAPFGQPYQTGQGFEDVAPIAAEHAVHIGWAIDTFDYNCAGNPGCVVENFTAALEAGAYGVVLLHSVHAQTAAALPEILDYIEQNGYELWTTEEVVCARFGQSSWRIVDGVGGGCEPESGGPDAGDGDGGGPRPDAAEGGGNPGDDEPDGDTVGGCGCGAAGTGGSAGGGLLLLALAVVWRRRP